eukprot:gene1029-1303_t
MQGAAWPSSARALPACNDGDSKYTACVSRRKEGMRSGHHGSYAQGYTRATMACTEGCFLVTDGKSQNNDAVNTFSDLVHTARQAMEVAVPEGAAGIPPLRVDNILSAYHYIFCTYKAFGFYVGRDDVHLLSILSRVLLMVIQDPGHSLVWEVHGLLSVLEPLAHLAFLRKTFLKRLIPKILSRFVALMVGCIPLYGLEINGKTYHCLVKYLVVTPVDGGLLLDHDLLVKI